MKNEPNDSLSERYDFRINGGVKQAFIEKCLLLDKQPQAMLREMIAAFIENKLTIKIDQTRHQVEKELYDVN